MPWHLEPSGVQISPPPPIEPYCIHLDMMMWSVSLQRSQSLREAVDADPARWAACRVDVSVAFDVVPVTW